MPSSPALEQGSPSPAPLSGQTPNAHWIPVVVEALLLNKQPQTTDMTHSSGSPGLPTPSALWLPAAV